MTLSALIEALISTQSPWLAPHPLERLYLSLGWGLVLAGLALWGMQRVIGRPSRLGQAAAVLLLLWCLWPGPWSPSFWLGLAFRAPSLLSVLLCLVWLASQFRPVAVPRPDLDALRPWAWAPILLGWLLLLDTLAVWPVSLYALGFAPLTLGVVALLCLLPWLLNPAQRGARAGAVLMGLVMVLYAALRLPSGNLWDALLDPWLWILVQTDWVRRALRRWTQRPA